jgi:hypothetical protein
MRFTAGHEGGGVRVTAHSLQSVRVARGYMTPAMEAYLRALFPVVDRGTASRTDYHKRKIVASRGGHTQDDES